MPKIEPEVELAEFIKSLMPPKNKTDAPREMDKVMNNAMLRDTALGHIIGCLTNLVSGNRDIALIQLHLADKVYRAYIGKEYTETLAKIDEEMKNHG